MTDFSSSSGVVSTGSSYHEPRSTGDHKFLSAPACLVPPATVAAVAAAAAAAFDSGLGGGGGGGTNPKNITGATSETDAGGGRFVETRSIQEQRSSASLQRDLQEQELKELLAAASIGPTSPAPPPPPPSGSTTLPKDDARRAATGTAAGQPAKGSQPRRVAVVDCTLAGGGGGEAAAPAAVSVSDSHPVLEMYRSVGEPLDPMSFERLKRRVGDAVEQDGTGLASVPELVDFLGALKRFSEGQVERLGMSGNKVKETADRPSDATAAQEEDTGGAEEQEQEEKAAAIFDETEEGGECEEIGGVCGEMEGGDCEEMEGVCDEMDDAGCGGGDRCCDAAAAPPVSAAPAAPGSLSEIILKFTTVADGNQASSFAVRREEGATVGRGAGNDISIPNDSCMGESDHASIVWRGGAFHVEDRGHPHGASVRIGTGRGLRDWPLDQGSMFSAGNSVFHTTEIDEERGMLLEIVAGPLKGERRRVRRDGATVGRATESTISIADRELSRNHSTIECEDNRSPSVSGSSSRCGGGGGGSRRSSRAGESDDGLGDSAEAVGLRDSLSVAAEEEFDDAGAGGGDEEGAPRRGEGEGAGRLEYFLCDVGSTNGTYVQLVGPYASSRRLELSDHILIGRTGFSINRFDWGVWEDRGARRTMEDKSVVIQDMAVESLTSLGLGPQTFLAVYDGHGGGEASAFLWQRLHVAIAEALEDATPRVAAALQQDRASERLAVFGSGGGGEAMRCDDGGGGKNNSSLNKGTGGGGGGGGGGGAWLSSAVLSSSSGAGGAGAGARMPPLPPAPPTPTPTSPPRPALAMTAVAPGTADAGNKGGSAENAPPPRRGREPGVKSDEPRSVPDGGGGGKGLWWSREAAAAVEGAKSGGCSPTEGPPSLSTAPSLPAEWLDEAREIAKAMGKDTTTGGRQRGGGGESPSCGGSGSAAAGGDAASGVCTEKDGGGGEHGGGGGGGGGQAAAEDGARQTDDGGGDRGKEASGDFGVASPPPSAGNGSGSGSPSGGGGAQSPGGGPSRPLATAGLPAEGGGGGVAHEGGAGYDRQRAPSAVDRVIEEVVSQAFLATDRDFLSTSNKPSSGSTATTAMVLGDRFYSFNVGDSRTILCRGGRAEVVSQDHKPSREDETERIKRAGGMVIHKRVMGELAVSRAFGDRAFKIGIKAILREEDEHQQSLAHGNHLEDLDDDDDDDDDEDDGLNHALAAPTTTHGGGGGGGGGNVGGGNEPSSLEESTADRNSLTMGRGSSGKLLPPPPAPTAPAAAPPAAPPSAPTAVPPAPPTTMAATIAAGKGGRRAIKPVTDPAEALITAEPEMLACRITPEDEFILLACDGLFDVFTSDEVVKIVRKELSRHGDTQRVCETLTRKAIDERYTQDNVSVVLVVLKKFW